MLHPAYILRGQFSQEGYQVGYLKRVRELLDATYVWQPPVAEGPPGMRVRPTMREIVEWFGRVRSAAVDIENAGPHITVTGFWGRGQYVGAGGITVRFRDGADPYPWAWDEWRQLVRTLHAWYGDPSVGKSMHNGQSHDIFLLERAGFTVRGFDFDTMLAVHIADPERKKDLGTVGTSMGGVPHWKHLAKGEGDGEGK